MRNSIIVLCLFLTQFGGIHAQYVIEDSAELETLKKLPLEKIYLHSNTSLFFPGEYLYYSMNCINTMTNRLSTISRVGYVELIDENHRSLFKQKVLLVGGKGQGDFFIPVTFPSGNYKLIAYTHWMRNVGLSQFYQDDIVIINPYQINQENLRNKKEETINLDVVQVNNIEFQLEDKSIQLQTEKNVFGKREKVSLVPRNYKGPLGHGNYSISVRLKNNLDVKPAMNATFFGDKYLNSTKILPKNINDSIYLPEQRGELFYGRVVDKEDNPVVNEAVIISIPGEDFQLKSAITDKSGSFYTYVNKPYTAATIIAQAIDKDANNMVSLLDKPEMEFETLQFNDFTLNSKMEKAILERSVYNQVENAFYSAKPDSILSNATIDPFDGGSPEIIKLDEFTRFPTIRETLVELVPNVWVKRLDNRNYTFWVREKLEKYEIEFESDPPLVMVDGVFVQDHTAILDFNARLVDKISILRDPLVLGDKKYLGMVVIETIEGDYLNRIVDHNLAINDLEMPTSLKNYFNQSYAAENVDKFKNIPDFRSQLYWNPTILIDQNSNEKNYEFYTSDISGEYEIVLEGFTTYGKPITVKKIITIE
ncbi:Ig-like domain-containing protein [Maribacter arcticus]|uniref:Ig-like domain-containing protein n=1 Tax=Maribacter arcticus TaxID=561365 RepID=UPI0030026E29